MRLTRPGRHALAFTLALGLAACGDDDPTGPGTDELSEAEAVVMMEALVEAGGFGMASSGGSGVAGAFAAPQTFPLDLTEDCPDGGSVAVVGEITVDDVTGQIAVDLNQTHQSCSATAGATGEVWTFNGNPGIGLEMSLIATETTFELDGTQQGGIAWSQGGRSGACSIDVTWNFSGSQTANTFAGSVSGSVCGHDVTETIELDWEL